MERRVSHEAICALEQPFVKVPTEQLQLSLRNTRKHLDREIGALTSVLSDPSSITRASVEQSVSRVTALKRKLVDMQRAETQAARRLQVRLEHLSQVADAKTIDDVSYARWTRTRLMRYVADYLLRNGHHKAAAEIISRHALHDLVDADLFAVLRNIEDALARHSCSECLQWCSENKTTLRKNKSTLEFSLRLQEFIELIRQNKHSDAIVYAKKFLAPWSETHMKDIQAAMALLIYPSTTSLPYKSLFDASRWHRLINEFRKDAFQLHTLPSQPVLSIALQCGLTLLKTPSCYVKEDKNFHCPICDDNMATLAAGLPFPQITVASAVCRISGALMDEDNPPMVTPKGNVYSKKALEKLAMEQGGRIKDPRTGHEFSMDELRKAFIT